MSIKVRPSLNCNVFRKLFLVSSLFLIGNVQRTHGAHDGEYKDANIHNSGLPYFLVSPSNCSISPNPASSILSKSISSDASTFFLIECPESIPFITIKFPDNRDDGKLVAQGSPGTSLQNISSITIRQKRVSKNSVIQLKDFYLCKDLNQSSTCESFQVGVKFAKYLTPEIKKITVLNAPMSSIVRPQSSDVYDVELYANIPATFAVIADHKNHFFVDSQTDLPNHLNRFTESSHLLTHRPRAEPGRSENISLYAATFDRSAIREYTVRIRTMASNNPRLANLQIAGGRLDPEFHSHTYSYFARVPEGRESFKMSLDGIDDRNTVCVIDENEESRVVGKGEMWIKRALKSSKNTILIDCTAQDQSNEVRYTLSLVPQRGGSTLLEGLEIIGARLDRPFDPLMHGPYVANLELQGKKNQGWVAFVARASNPNANVTVEYIPIDKRSGRTPWFFIEKGDLRKFRIGVRTLENPVEEEYHVHVDRRGAWYETAKIARKVGNWIRAASILSSLDTPASFLQNMHFMQFLSTSNRINVKPEKFGYFSAQFNPTNMQFDDASWAMRPPSTTEFISTTNGSDFYVDITKRKDHFIIDTVDNVLLNKQALIQAAAAAAASVSGDVASKNTDSPHSNTAWRSKQLVGGSPLLSSIATKILSDYYFSSSQSDIKKVTSLRQLSTLVMNEDDRLNLLEDINAEYNRHIALLDHMSSIVVITLFLLLTGVLYFCSVAYFVNIGIKAADGSVRDMPKILHPVRFWSFVFDFVLIGYSQAAFNIMSCPSALRSSEFLLFNLVVVTPKAMMYFAAVTILLFPLSYLILVGVVLFSLKETTIFSEDLFSYHKKELSVAKARQRYLSWIPVLSNLLAIEIRDVAPIYRADYVSDSVVATAVEKPSIIFTEDKRMGGPCHLVAPEFASQKQNAIESRNKTNDAHYSMLPPTDREDHHVHYDPKNDELKVSLGGLRSSYANDSQNCVLYHKYPEAEIGTKKIKVKNPYGYEIDCHAQIQMKHLSNLWQMSELPHHFRFWIPRQNCQGLDSDGWNVYYDHSQRNNFFYYLIDRVIMITIIGLITCWAEKSGVLTSVIILLLSLSLAALYTPSAVASGTSKWYAQMKTDLYLEKKEKEFDTAEKKRRTQWPFDNDSAKQRVIHLQREKESLDVCGHGGWFARNEMCGINDMAFLKHRWWFCFREWITGAPGFELTKCLIMSALILGSNSVNMVKSGPASTAAIVFVAFGSFFLNINSLLSLYNQLDLFSLALKRGLRRALIWCYETISDTPQIFDRCSHLFKVLHQRCKGISHTTFDFAAATGERVRDYNVAECVIVADEVGLQFRGALKPSDTTKRLSKEIGSRHTERYGLTKTLYQAGPIGIHRKNLDDSFPVRLPFKQFYLGKLIGTQGIAATIQIVNHGYRSHLKDLKAQNVFSSEDDSYLSLYRDPKLMPEWGVVECRHQGHGYVIQYDGDTHTLLIRGPSLREGITYRIRSEPKLNVVQKTGDEESSAVGSVTSDIIEGEGTRVTCDAVCTSSGTLCVPIQQGKPPSLYEPIEIQRPDGDRFVIHPEEVKVHFDPVCRELTLRHRLLLENDDNSLYKVAYTVARRGVDINETASCHEMGIVQIKLTRQGIPNLHSIISFTDSNGAFFTANPKDCDAHRAAVPRSREEGGIGLLFSKFTGKCISMGRQIAGVDALMDTVVEDTVPCTVVQCVNPTIGRYRVEPNFREVMRSIRAQIHSLEAQRSQLQNTHRLATSWYTVMSGTEFCKFWKKRQINIVSAEGLWVNPLRDTREPLVKSQQHKIEKLIPEFRLVVQQLFGDRISKLENNLHKAAIWVKAYDDISLYGAQLQKDMAESSGYTVHTGLENYVKKIQCFKQQYESQLDNFIYPFVVEERQLSRMPNVSAQLRQWQKQLAVWLRTEEDAPLMNDGWSTPRSLTSTGTELAGDPASLERTVVEVMHALKDNINRCEDSTIGKFRSVLHYVTDSLSVRGPYTNWRPDPFGGHLALVRIWYPKDDGTPDFKKDPVWNPCCVKLSGNAIKILLPGKDDVEFAFSTPYYWSHVLGHSIQLDCFEALQVTTERTLPVGHTSNAMLKGMPGCLVCHLTSALPHVGDRHIRLVENGAPGVEIVMKRENGTLNNDYNNGLTSRSSEGDSFIISLGKRILAAEAHLLPSNEVQVTGKTAQSFPLKFRFGERFVAKWKAVIEEAQMDKPPLVIDEEFGLAITEGGPTEIENHQVSITYNGSESVRTEDASFSSQRSAEKVAYDGEWQNYKYHGKGRLIDLQGKEIYNGDWLDGRRWGRGRYVFKDESGHWWEYTGEFKADELCGKGEVTLIDEKELTRLKLSSNYEDRMKLIRFAGEFQSPHSRGRLFTTPLMAKAPRLSPDVLKQLFDRDSSFNEQHHPLVIDIRKTISCDGALDVLDEGSEAPNSLDTLSSSYVIAKNEYLPHQSRWSNASDGFDLYNKLVKGTAHFADGGIYEGELLNGLPHGRGRYMSGDLSIKCEGHWSHGVPNGYAILTEVDQNTNEESTYWGTFSHGQRSGHGIQVSKNGSIYVEGNWTENAITESPQTLVHIEHADTDKSNAISRFSGSVKGGLPSGEGKLTWVDGIHYRGSLYNGLRDGQGVIRDKTNRVLVSASWKKDVPHGRVARVVQGDGKVYTGDMNEGHRDGIGELYHSEKGEPFFEGLWVKDVAHGRGTLYAKDGIYEGEYFKGKRHGKGQFEFFENPAPNGKLRLYEGDWKNDLPHGIGKYRNELGVENTYKFSKGQIDKSSVRAYKSGMCGKAPIIGVAPTVSPNDISASTNFTFGPMRNSGADTLTELLGTSKSYRSWKSLILNAQSMYFANSNDAPTHALPPKLTVPHRPLSEDGTHASSDFQTDSPVRQRALKVFVINGKKFTLIESRSNVFVKAHIGSVTKKTKNATGQSDTLIWKAGLNFPLRKEEKIILEVWNRDNKKDDTKDRLIGSGEVNLIKFLDTNARESEILSVPIFLSENKTQPLVGVIDIQLSIVERQSHLQSDISLSSSVGETSASQPTSHQSPIPPPFVHLNLHSARDLINMDAVKNMDPYVKVTMGKIIKTTKVQKRAGISPKFDEEFYLPYNNEPKLVLEVFDKDMLKSDDFVGRAEIDLPVHKLSGNVNLYRQDKKKQSAGVGVIDLSINCVLS